MAMFTGLLKKLKNLRRFLASAKGGMGDLLDWLTKPENIKSRRAVSLFLILTPVLWFLGGAWQGTTLEGPIFTASGIRAVFLGIMVVMFVMGILLSL
ncbi:MAG: hypothetical protein ACLQED_12590 [Desulfobaccales bacterium]